MSILRVAAREPRTPAEGPGLRYAVWLQGCSIRCAGCCNPHLFDGAAPGWSAEGLADEVVRTPGIEGLTVLGGEPFDQAEGLGVFAEAVRRAGLSVIVFSGFTLAELRGRADASRVLAAVDVLVDGRYDASQPETERLWVGSRNQAFHYLTDRYEPSIERGTGRVETLSLRIRPDGSVQSHGWPVWGRRAD